tara:strand:+ start:15477 stop:16307 length:831 start_codon:yes stop_codon:yes gene_type:complete
MKNDFSVSVIVTTFNSQDVILETLKSINLQTFRSFECIIIDDKSDDDTVKVIQNFISENSANNFSVHQLKKNSGGPAKPRNIGIKLSQYEYIAFCDSDDIWETNKLNKQVKALEENDSLGLVASHNSYINEDNNPIDPNTFGGFLLKFLRKIFGQRIVLFLNPFILSSIMVKRSWIKTENFSEDPLLVALEDWDLWIRLHLRNIESLILPESLVKYRIMDSSISKRSSSIRIKRSYYMFWRLLANKKIHLFQWMLSNLSVFIFLHIKYKLFNRSSK